LRRNRLVEAAASFEPAIVLKEGVVANHYNLAVALDRQGLKSRAITAYRRALELAPELAEGHRRLGELLIAEGDAEQAAQSFRRGAACAPDTTAGRVNLAKASMLDGELREAEALLRQGIALDPNSDLLHKELGDLLSTQGNFDEAIAAYDRANDLNSSEAPAHLNAVFFRKGTEADRPRLARMLSSLRDTSLYYEHRIHLHFACGKLLDDLGEYQEAILHFEAGNRLRGRETRFNRSEFSRDCDRLTQRFTPAFFAANWELGLDDETPLFIVGMPRSGTTLVEQILSSHPAIAAGGELTFWPRRPGAPGIANATFPPLNRRTTSREIIWLCCAGSRRERPGSRTKRHSILTGLG
jgi:Flp pilus assembly protein TadD